MQDLPIAVYGIRNCDTVRKARLWLDQQGLAYQFHDFKTDGVPPAQLDLWLQRAGWDTLLNRKGTTWRTFDAATQAGAAGSAGARSIMLAHPSVIKRPVVMWGGPDAPDISVGFNADVWQARLAQGR